MATPTTSAHSDVLSLWNSKNILNKSNSNRLHVESNPLLTSIFQMVRTVPIVVDVKKMTQQYVGIDVEEWWGWKIEEIFGEGVLSYTKLIHPSDLGVHNLCNKLLFYIFERCSTEDKYNLNILLNFKLRKSDGSYIHITQSAKILELDPDGSIRSLLVLLQENNTLSDSYQRRYIRFWGKDFDGRLYEYLPDVEDLQQIELPSKREIEILSYLVSGEESKTIAEYLSISKHTVDTHRRHLLQKFYLKNTSELINLVHITRLLDPSN